MNRLTKIAAAAALCGAAPASAVSLNPDGLGQALIFPYYTVRAAEGNAFNTYVSVVNTTARAKAVRVRFREGRLGKEVVGFNLFLSPNDVWTGAVVPSGEGARVISRDTSCTDPAVTTQSGERIFELVDTAFSGAAADAAGAGLDRVREGYIEMLEMAELGGVAAQAVIHTVSGTPANCGAVAGSTTLDVAAPGGGLMGSYTLINVSNGMDFTASAEALDALASRPYYRVASDPYPDFDVDEIDPVSTVVAGTMLYRSRWIHGIDAVSAALMRRTVAGEYVLDDATASLTDFVLTSPTRRLHTSANTFAAPFSAPNTWGPHCVAANLQVGERVSIPYFNREERSLQANFVCGFLCPPGTPPTAICAAAAVGSVRNQSAHMPPENASTSHVVGSITRGMLPLQITPNFHSGWMAFDFFRQTLTSLSSSVRLDLLTGHETAGAHVHAGLPVVGVALRTFRNGRLDCGGSACQGNFGGAFPLKGTRSISP